MGRLVIGVIEDMKIVSSEVMHADLPCDCIRIHNNDLWRVLWRLLPNRASFIRMDPPYSVTIQSLYMSLLTSLSLLFSSFKSLIRFEQRTTYYYEFQTIPLFNTKNCFSFGRLWLYKCSSALDQDQHGYISTSASPASMNSKGDSFP